LLSDALRIRPQNGQSKRIGEDPALLQHLMSGAVKRCGQGGLAWFSELHIFGVYQDVREGGRYLSRYFRFMAGSHVIASCSKHLQ